MLIKIALVLLACWLAALFSPFDFGKLVHLPLMIGLMFLFLGALRARDAAVRGRTDPKA